MNLIFPLLPQPAQPRFAPDAVFFLHIIFLLTTSLYFISTRLSSLSLSPSLFTLDTPCILTRAQLALETVRVAAAAMLAERPPKAAAKPVIYVSRCVLAPIRQELPHTRANGS